MSQVKDSKIGTCYFPS